MANHPLMGHFNYFFGRLNPSSTFEKKASAHYSSVKALIEDRTGLAGELSPICFLQGSYRHETATYTINDVDIVALCQLWHPASGNGGHSYNRDEIFGTVAAPLLNDWRYKDRVRYNSQSMCIKLDTEPRIEILPVVFRSGNHDPSNEPFRLFRPENNQWEDGYARYHKSLLSWKNQESKTKANFVPAIKVFKHLRTQFSLDAISFHLECLLFSLPDHLFLGGPADYIPALLGHISATPASSWYGQYLYTPSGERDIFVDAEWKKQDWEKFHEVATVWTKVARLANQAADKDDAIEYWRILLGEDSFPRNVS